MPYILNQRCHWDLVPVVCWNSIVRQHVSGSPQSCDPSALLYPQTALRFVIKLFLDRMEWGMLRLSPHSWDSSGRGPRAIQEAQTVGVQGLRGHWEMLSENSGTSQWLKREILVEMEPRLEKFLLIGNVSYSGCCSQGTLTRRSLVQSPSPPFHILKCPSARYWTPNWPWWLFR